jgi:hypothetical protein
VMLDEGVHGALLCGEIPGAYRYERLRELPSRLTEMGYQGRSPWLVSLIQTKQGSGYWVTLMRESVSPLMNGSSWFGICRLTGGQSPI